jgi:hypothetical protein
MHTTCQSNPHYFNRTSRIQHPAETVNMNRAIGLIKILKSSESSVSKLMWWFPWPVTSMIMPLDTFKLPGTTS